MITSDYEMDLTEVFNAMPWHVYLKDTAGRYIKCNANQAKTLNLSSPQQIFGLTNQDLVDKETAALLNQNDEYVIANKKEGVFEENIHVDGRNWIFLTRKSPILSPVGDVIGIIGISINVTEQKEHEAALEQAKEAAEIAHQAKTEFLRNMSHDLRTPFSGILGLAEYLARRETDLKKRELLGHIVSSAQQFLSLLNEIFYLSSLESRELKDNYATQKPFYLSEMLQQITELVTPEIENKKLHFRILFETPCPYAVVGDKLKIHRTLLNLVTNAIKFTEQGQIHLKLKILHKTDTQLMVRILVEDTGIGIAADKLDYIFERFHRLTACYKGIYEGMGIGLYVVNEFVQQLKGHIFVSSQPGQGTTFALLLPLPISTQLEPLREVPSQSIDYAHLQPHILLIEDNEIAQISAQYLLEEFNCKVTIAGSEREALVLTQTQAYDLILMDIGLPDSDGYATAAKIKEQGGAAKDTPIFGLTAQTDRDTERHSKLITTILQKPLSAQTCKRLIEFIAVRQYSNPNHTYA